MVTKKVSSCEVSVGLLRDNDSKVTAERIVEPPKEAHRVGNRQVAFAGKQNGRAVSDASVTEVPLDLIASCSAACEVWRNDPSISGDPIRSGELFQRMMAADGISEHALSLQTGTPEATIHECLAYVQVRDHYLNSQAANDRDHHGKDDGFGERARELANRAVRRLSRRQVDLYKSLPDELRIMWLNAEAPMTVIPKHIANGLVSTPLMAVASSKLRWALPPQPSRFDKALNRALTLVEFRDVLPDFADRDDFLAIVVDCGFSPAVLEVLPFVCQNGQFVPALSVSDWNVVLKAVRDEESYVDERSRIASVKSGIDRVLCEKGLDEEPLFTPQTKMFAYRAAVTPFFIRDSRTLTCTEKVSLGQTLHQGAEDAEDRLEAARRVVADLERLHAQGVQSLVPLASRAVDERAMIAAERVLADRNRDQERLDLCERLAQTIVERAGMNHDCIGDYPVVDVLADSLAAMPRSAIVVVMGLLDEVPATAVIRTWLNLA
jgi:hypothetical protein